MDLIVYSHIGYMYMCRAQTPRIIPRRDRAPGFEIPRSATDWYPQLACRDVLCLETGCES